MAVLKKISTIASSFMQVAHYSALHLRYPVICLVDALFQLLPLSFIYQDILASSAPPLSLLRSSLITVITSNSSNVCAIFRLISCTLGAGRGWAGPSIGLTRAVPLSSLLGASSPLPPLLASQKWSYRHDMALSDNSTWHHITSHHITLQYSTSHHITSHHITSHHITSHHMTWHDMTWHDMTWHDMT